MRVLNIFILAFALCFTSINAQTIIEHTDFTLKNGQKIYIQGLSTAAFTDMEIGENMNWDFSNAPKVGELYSFEYTQPAINQIFPQATHSRNTMFGFPSIGFVVPTVNYFSLNADGFFDLGNSHEETLIPLSQDGSMSAKVTGQTSRFMPSPRMGFTFPMKYDEADEGLEPEPVQRKIDIILNIPDAGLVNAPFTYVRTELVYFKSVGSGSLKLDGFENPEDVVVYGRVRAEIDSFYLYGMPAPEALLTAFGLEQGSILLNSTVYFFAKGYPNAILTMGIGGEDEILFVEQLAYNPTMSTEDNIIAKSNSLIYPNPSTGDFTVDTGNLNDATNIEVYSMDGNLLLKKRLDAGSSQHQVNLINAPNGSYIYTISNNNGKTITNGRFLISR